MAFGAYILLKVEPFKTAAVVGHLKKVKGAIVHEVLGPYDIIVQIKAESPQDLTKMLRTGIRSIQGVADTLTCTWMD